MNDPSVPVQVTVDACFGSTLYIALGYVLHLSDCFDVPAAARSLGIPHELALVTMTQTQALFDQLAATPDGAEMVTLTLDKLMLRAGTAACQALLLKEDRHPGTTREAIPDMEPDFDLIGHLVMVRDGLQEVEVAAYGPIFQSLTMHPN